MSSFVVRCEAVTPAVVAVVAATIFVPFFLQHVKVVMACAWFEEHGDQSQSIGFVVSSELGAQHQKWVCPNSIPSVESKKRRSLKITTISYSRNINTL